MLTVDQPIVFVDTETTHLERPRARPWEIAMIYRPQGAVDASRDEHYHLMVAGVDLAAADPEALTVGRFEERFGPSSPAAWVTEDHAAAVVASLTRPVDGRRVALVGCCPSFDAEVLTAMLRRHGRAPEWDHHTHDLVSWTYGQLAGSIDADLVMPMRSSDLSAAVGVPAPSPDARHTAVGDARWARDWWDQLMTGAVR